MEVKVTKGHRQLYIKKCTWLHETNKTKNIKLMHFEKYKGNFCSETEATTLTPLTVKLEETNPLEHWDGPLQLQAQLDNFCCRTCCFVSVFTEKFNHYINI